MKTKIYKRNIINSMGVSEKFDFSIIEPQYDYWVYEIEIPDKFKVMESNAGEYYAYLDSFPYILYNFNSILYLIPENLWKNPKAAFKKKMQVKLCNISELKEIKE